MRCEYCGEYNIFAKEIKLFKDDKIKIIICLNCIFPEHRLRLFPELRFL